jgi:DNA-binding NarL/FixJ family response regulator
MKTSTVIIADDHPVFRKGLRDIIGSNAHLQVIGEADNGETALALIMKEVPDVAVVDIEMPGLSGIEIVRRVRESALPVAMLILTMYEDEDVFTEAMSAGAMGYMLKDSAILEIVRAVTSVAQGGIYISAALTSTVLRARNGATPQQREKLGLHLLSPTELRVLRMIADDKTSREISEELHISPRTVDNHRAHICGKLKLTGVHSLIKFALRHRALLD